MRICVIGAGAVGGTIGGGLARAGFAVNLIDTWAEHVAAIRRDGLAVEGVPAPEGAALTLQNGIGNVEALATVLGRRQVLGGSTMSSFRTDGPGRVGRTHAGPTTIGGLRTEIDALNGALVREARALDLEVPFNEALTLLVRGAEAHHRRRVHGPELDEAAAGGGGARGAVRISWPRAGAGRAGIRASRRGW
jgi:ketopantoate reductase